MKPSLLSSWLGCCSKSYIVLLKVIIGYSLEKNILLCPNCRFQICRVITVNISLPGLNSLSCSCHYSYQSCSYIEWGHWNYYWNTSNFPSQLFSSCSQQMLSLEKVKADHVCGSKLSTEKASLHVTVTVCTLVNPAVFGMQWFC